MAILTKREVWERPKAPRATTPDLTVEEVANVHAALRFLQKRYGGVRKLAVAIRVNKSLIARALLAKGKPSAGLTIRAARAASVPVEDVLAGRWPPTGACPHCGRT